MHARNVELNPYPANEGVYMSETIEWIFASEAAAIMNVSIGNVAYLCRNNRIRCRKWGNTWQVSKADALKYERSKRNPTWLYKTDDNSQS